MEILRQAQDKLETIRHSLAHILAYAVKEIYPSVKFGIGPAIENGFYYDFDFSEVKNPKSEIRNPKQIQNSNDQNSKQEFKLTPEDLPKIEKRMRELIKSGFSFESRKITKSEVEQIFTSQPYKLELINELCEDGLHTTCTVYQSGKFTDLCAGPHVNTAKEIPTDAFKLEKTAGAYWRGSEKKPMLTRIYGLAFATKKELDDYVKLQEEAKKRDHRVIGERLNFFMLDEKIGKGLPLWLPKGYFVRHLLEEYMYNIEKEEGYLHVLTPILAKEELYKTSGHLAHYKDDMYSPIEIEGERYYLKPMNCPHHHSVYKHTLRSYKELPLRIAEFGTVHRFERSGVLTGIIRTRGFTQNDAHIYATPETLEKEIVSILKIIKKVYRDFKIEDYWFRLSLPDFNNKEKYGDIENKAMWEKGAAVLKNVLQKQKLKFVEAVGEASFYGPKIDVQIKNVFGKEDTIATVQIDYYSAPKFDLTYIDKAGQKQPPVIIHRAILGSFERFFAFLLEKTAGDLPLWLCPEQVWVIPITSKHAKYAKAVGKELMTNDLRAQVKDGDETVSKKIREGEMQKIPYLLIVGDKEMKAKSIAIRKRSKGDLGMMKLTKFVKIIKTELDSKK